MSFQATAASDSAAGRGACEDSGKSCTFGCNIAMRPKSLPTKRRPLGSQFEVEPGCLTATKTRRKALSIASQPCLGNPGAGGNRCDRPNVIRGSVARRLAQQRYGEEHPVSS